MQQQQNRTGRIFSLRLPLSAIILVLGAQGCAHQAPPPVAKAAPETTKAAEQPAKAAEALPPPPAIIEQEALDRLKVMSDKLSAAKAFTYHSRSTVELPARTGQFLTHFVQSEVSLERPNKLHSEVTGDVPNFHFYYDGSKVSAFDPQKNMYAVADAPGTIDEMLPFIIEKAGIDFPSADFMLSDPYAVLTKDLTHAIVVGSTKINGIPCEHYAFMNTTANWEIWIESGPGALPLRMAVTYKAVPNFPRFLVEYQDWKLNPKLNASQFVFKKPSGAKQIEFASRVANPAQ